MVVKDHGGSQRRHTSRLLGDEYFLRLHTTVADGVVTGSVRWSESTYLRRPKLSDSSIALAIKGEGAFKDRASGRHYRVEAF